MYKKLISFFLILIVVLVACGEQVAEDFPPNAPQSTVDADALEWKAKDILLPDADEALEGVFDNQKLQSDEMLFGMSGEIIYRIVRMYDEDNVIAGYCVQKLEEPYESWENFTILPDEWIEGSYGYVWSVSLGVDGSVYALLESMGGTESSYYKARWTEQNGHVVEKIPDGNLEREQMFNISLMYVDGKNVLYLVTDKRMQYFDGTFIEKEVQSDIGYPWQIVENSTVGGQVYLCGNSEEGIFGIRSAIDNKVLFESGDVLAIGGSQVAFAEETEGYLCTTMGVWRFHAQENKIENVLDFQEEAYKVDKICGAWVREDGKLLVLMKVDGEHVLLEGGENSQSVVELENSEQSEAQLTEMEKALPTDKIELELASTFPSAFLKEAVTDFNRHNTEYRIVLRSRKDGEDYNDFQTKIQAEVSSGGGPALLSDDVINLQDAASQGFLRDLTADFVEQKSVVLENAWTAGEVNGASYAIPYCFSISTLVTSTDVVGDKDSWTSEEIMQHAKSYGAKVAVAEWDSPMLFCMLASRSGLIDWKSGKSYLNSGEAVALLEFAEEYGVKGTESDVGVKIAEGEDLAVSYSISGLFGAECMEGVFQGKESYIGWPTEDGSSGSTMETDSISVNQACQYPEGANEFIRYLLSENMQDKFARGASSNGVSGFPIDKQALDRVFEYAEELSQNPLEKSGIANFMGYDFIREALSEEGMERLHKLFENASSDNSYIEEISDILQEETPAYFSGNKSAQEVCNILQNRVQLYLDEIN